MSTFSYRKLIRFSDLKISFPKCRSALYEDQKDGLLPPAIHIGERAVAWVEEEIEAVKAARIAGKSDEYIRQLVKSLVAGRESSQLPEGGDDAKA